MKLFLILFCFLLIPCSLCQAGDSIRIELSTRDAKALNRSLYGFNQAYPPLLGYSVKSFSGEEKIKDLNIKSLRFPGGTAANFYRWSFDGYDVNDLKMFPDMASGHRKKIFQRYGKNGEKVGFADFIEWAGRDGITPVFVLNLSTEPDFEAIVGALEHARRVGVSPIYCELGNELYFKNQGGKLNDVSTYIRVARKAISRLKAFDGSIRTAVPVSDNPKARRGQKWNAALAQSGLDFDAIVIHPYLKEEHPPDAYASGKAGEFIRKDMKTLMDRFRNMFPGKKMWITEWNIENRPKRDIHRTLYGALFMADFFLFMIGEPDVELTSQHRLLGRTHGVMEPHYGKRGIHLLKHYPYYLWEMVGRVFSECTQTSRPRLFYDGKEANASFPPIGCRLFFNETDAHLLLLNRGKESIRCDMSIDGDSVGSGVRETIRGDFPGSRLGPGVKKASFHRLGEFNNGVDIPPLSINLITFPIQTR